MKYLVLLEEGLQDARVINELVRFKEAGASFHLLVPVRPVSEEEKRLIEFEVDEPPLEGDHAAVMAHWRLSEAVAILDDAGFDGLVDGTVGRADPIDAVEDAISGDAFDGVIVVTSPSGWVGRLHLDTAGRITRRLDTPVVHIEANRKQTV